MKKIICLCLGLFLISCASIDAFTYNISVEEARSLKEEYNKLDIWKSLSFADFIKLKKEYSFETIEKIKKEWDTCELKQDTNSQDFYRPLLCNDIKFEDYAKLYLNFKDLNVSQVLNNCGVNNCFRDYNCKLSWAEKCLKNEKQALLDIQKQEKSEREYEKWKKETEKKFGYKFCEGNSSWIDPLHEVVPMNCIHIRKQGKVMQQLADGTLVSGGDGVYIPMYIFFIEKNNMDSELLDDQRLPQGYFVRTGNYTYRSILGAKKTIMKVKRVGY